MTSLRRPTRRRFVRLLGTATVGSSIAAEARAGSVQESTSESWPMFQYDAANSGQAPRGWTSVETPLTERWTFQASPGNQGDAKLYTNPIVANGRVFVGTASDNFYALDAETGEHQWTFETVGTGTAAVNSDTVYVGSLDNFLYALDTATGTVQWELDTGSDLRTAPAIVDGTVYVKQSGLGTDIIAVDAATGEERWSSNAAGFAGPHQGAPAVVDGTVYATGGSSTQPDVIALDAETGEQRWGFATDRDTTPTETGTSLTSFGNPAVADGTVYVGSEHGFLYALSARSGDKRWEAQVGPVYSSPAVADDVLVVSAMEPARIVGLDLASGQTRWTVDIGDNTGDAVDGSPVVVGDRVVATADDGNLHVIDATDGSELDSYRVRAHTRTTPAVANGIVYTASTSVYALEPDTGSTTVRSPVSSATATTGTATEPTTVSPSTSKGASPTDEGLTRQAGTASTDSDGGSESNAGGPVLTRFEDEIKVAWLGVLGLIGSVTGYVGYNKLAGNTEDSTQRSER